jgi:very-short-patch-repair endonuclease
MSELESTFETHLHVHGLPPAVREFPFALPRKFRFDFAWIEERIAVEIEGGTRNNGRHNRHTGFTKDCEKYNLAARDGWKVFRFTGEMVNDGRAVNFVKETFERIGTKVMDW